MHWAPALRFEIAGPVLSIVAGQPANQVSAGAWGAVIGSGGTSSETTRVTDQRGVAAGGSGNRAGDDNGVPDSAMHATVGVDSQRLTLAAFAVHHADRRTCLLQVVAQAAR
ncbi:MAG: hypothetical protein R2844_03915 [Caldilineales bacterium]